MTFKSFLFFILSSILLGQVNAQAVTASYASSAGRFNTCNLGLPGISVSYVSGSGSAVVNGALVCMNPNDSSLLNITLSNIRWNQTPNSNWLHGLYFPFIGGAVIQGTALAPGSWIFTPAGCTGGCPGSSSGGSGYYFAGSMASSCCPNGGSTPNPCDNYGDGSLTCTTPFSLGFQLKIRNGSIPNTSLFFKLRGSSDGATGCWNTVDNTSNEIIFKFSTVRCNPVPIMCNPAGSATLTTNLPGSAYQWQRSTDSINFNNISDNSNYGGTNTSALSLINIPSSSYGEQFRCLTDGVSGQVHTIKFGSNWTGTVNSDWNTPGNWSCNAVPDAFTDATISGGNVVVSANCVVRSLILRSNANVTVNPGVNFTVIH